jgi:predicted dehydrogenase
MSSPVAVVIGTGFIGPVHVEALRRLGVRVKGVLGSSVEKSRAAALTLGLERAYDSYDGVLADSEVTCVHLASPNPLHRSQVLAALAAGKHVVCEKPLGLDSTETAELVRAAREHSELVTAVCYNVRFYPLALHARALVQRGDMGDVLHIHGSYEQDWLLFPTDFNWRVLAEEGGALRAMADIGTHWLDLAMFLTGLEIESVLADLRTVHPVRQRPPSGSIETFAGKSGARPGAVGTQQTVAVSTDDFGAVLFRCAGGARGMFVASQVSAGRKNCIRFELAGTKRSLAWNSERPDELWIGDRTDANRELLRDPALLDATAARFSNYPGGHAEGYPDTFKQMFRAVYDDVAQTRRSSAPLYATFVDAHRELLLCEAMAESHRRGAWVAVKGTAP